MTMQYEFIKYCVYIVIFAFGSHSKCLRYDVFSICIFSKNINVIN